MTFNCVAHGIPKPVVFWEFKGRGLMFPMQDYGRLFITQNGQLKIREVEKSDEGVYRCSAVSQGLGGSSAEARLTVKGNNNFIQNGCQ